MCQSGGKMWANYFQNSTTKEFLEALSLNIGIPRLELVEIKRGGNHSGTWVHPKVAIHLANWVSPQFYVAVVNLVERYIKGNVTTEESQQEADAIAHKFEYDPLNLTKPGLYLNNMPGIIPDSPITSLDIVGKIGKAVDQSVAKRNNSYYKNGEQLGILFAIPSTYPGKAEIRLKDMLRSRGFLRKGTYPNGKRGIEIIIYRIENIPEIQDMYEKASIDDVFVITDSAVLIEQEKTKQELEKTKQSLGVEEEKTKQKVLDFEMLKLQFEMQKYNLQSS